MKACRPLLPLVLPSLLAMAALGTPGRAEADPGAPTTPPTVDFNRDVRPILAKNCFACHGADEQHREAGLRLDLRGDAIKPLADGKTAIVPGHADQSELVRRITSADADERMPPANANTTLTEDQIGESSPNGSAREPATACTGRSRSRCDRSCRGWLRAGRPEWPANPVDLFIGAKLRAAGLAPSPPADPYTLVRRLSLDLRGLPPTLAEVEEFVRDSNPGAYERLVDRMLADPAFGERWARPWLDLARYADSAGYASDPLRTIWLYRDWVIDAFNANMPFDQFTIEQLAGDLLPKPTTEQLDRHRLQSQHDDQHRRGDRRRRISRRGRQRPGRHDDGRLDGPDDRLCQVPQPQIRPDHAEAEYYRFFAIFNQTADNDQPNESPTLVLPSPEAARQARPIDAHIAALKKRAGCGEGSRKSSSGRSPSWPVPAASSERPRDARAAARTSTGKRT